MAPAPEAAMRAALYTSEERARRDASPWTMVQGILAPIQFAAFVVSLWLMARWYTELGSFEAAAWSVVVKTALLLTIMVTGSIWEKAVFGRWLFAPAFYWEDVVSMGVIALHLAYLIAFLGELLTPGPLMALALAAYAAYVVNFVQFVWKLRMARASAVPA